MAGQRFYRKKSMKYSKDKIMAHLYDTENECRKIISGWWKDSAFEIYEALDTTQKGLMVEGNLCEIGTWYGRSFLALRNFTEDNETCIGIDIFHMKKYYEELLNNIKGCFGDLNGCKIFKVPKGNTTVDKLNVLRPYSPIRIFYIDGDHAYEGALNDLEVAKSVLHKDGIMFLDDYENPRYGSDVAEAVDDFLKNNTNFTLAFSSTQRIFLCQSHMVYSYVSAMVNLDWIVGKDAVWSDLISFNHPHGYNSWKTENKK